jgi:hypothetical protein
MLIFVVIAVFGATVVSGAPAVSIFIAIFKALGCSKVIVV